MEFHKLVQGVLRCLSGQSTFHARDNLVVVAVGTRKEKKKKKEQSLSLNE